MVLACIEQKDRPGAPESNARSGHWTCWNEKRKRGPKKVLAAGLAWLLVACAPQHDGDPLDREPVAASRTDVASVHPAVAALATELVVEFEGPGDRPFRTTRRTPAIEQYPCAECHTPGMEATGEDSHADIAESIAHPARLDGACDACHAPGDRSVLQGRSGETYSLDESYRLCAECHFQQAEDWAAGAHGKREGAWEGRRVVRSCTGCHDPHDPAFDQRQPMRFPRIPRTGGTH